MIWQQHSVTSSSNKCFSTTLWKCLHAPGAQTGYRETMAWSGNPPQCPGAPRKGCVMRRHPPSSLLQSIFEQENPSLLPLREHSVLFPPDISLLPSAVCQTWRSLGISDVAASRGSASTEKRCLFALHVCARACVCGTSEESVLQAVTSELISCRQNGINWKRREEREQLH